MIFFGYCIPFFLCNSNSFSIEFTHCLNTNGTVLLYKIKTKEILDFLVGCFAVQSINTGKYPCY